MGLWMRWSRTWGMRSKRSCSQKEFVSFYPRDVKCHFLPLEASASGDDPSLLIPFPPCFLPQDISVLSQTPLPFPTCCPAQIAPRGIACPVCPAAWEHVWASAVALLLSLTWGSSADAVSLFGLVHWLRPGLGEVKSLALHPWDPCIWGKACELEE